jgi:acyl carrier protein
MDNSNFARQFAALFEVPAERITDSFNMAEEGEWDSITFLSTLALIDSHYHRIVDPISLQSVATFGQLKQLIRSAED